MRAYQVLLVLFGVLVPVHAATTVSWSTTTVSSSVLAGTMKATAVSFTASQDLSNVDVRVVRELQPFVVITPSHFDFIAKNTTSSVTLVVSVSENTAAAAYAGTVQLRSSTGSHRLLPQPLPVSVVVQTPSSATIPNGVSLPSSDRFTTDQTGVNYARNEIIVFVTPAARQDQVMSLAERFGASFLGHDAGLNFYQLLLPFETLDTALTIVSQLEAEPIVRFAVPHLFERASASTIPSDPSWGFGVSTAESWGQSLVSLPDAWSLSTGGTQIKIGIVDVGFDPKHEDFVLNGPQSDLQSNFDQFRDHGTSVASLAAAVGNNARGIAGAMWASDLRFYACSANNDGIVSEPRCWEVAKEAIDRGARVINVSLAANWSATCYPLLTDSARQLLFQESANGWRDVINHSAGVPGGVIFVFGSGNDFTPFDLTAGASLSKEFVNVLSVGAVNGLVVGGVVVSHDQASYSNFGTLSVWAPGGDGSVTMCGNRRSNPRISPPPLEIWTAEPNNAYGFSGPGTSLAAPFVSGTAGLMLSANSSLTAPEVKNYIDATADPTGQLDPSGNPIRVLNAFHAVQQAIARPQFDFAVDFLSVAGNVNGGAGFFDDFNDGSLTTPPTSNLVCNLNTAPVSESGGFLHLSSADGANTFTPGFLVDNCILGQNANAFRLNDGSGNSVITASFRADVPSTGQGAGLQLFTFGMNTNELVNINFSPGPVVVALVQPASGPQSTQSVPINLTGVQRVMLRLTFNDSTNQVTHSFSVNGGATFTDIVFPQPGKVMTTGSQAVVSVFGSVQLPSSP